MSGPVALPQTVVTIDGETYTIQLLDAVVGSELYFKLLNAVGGSLASLGDLDVKGDIDEEGVKTDLALRAIGALMKGLSKDLLVECRETFAAHCSVRKEALEPKLKHVFGNHFAGRYAHMSKWLFECVKVNFADFLDESLVQELKAKLKGALASKSPPA